MRSDKEPRVGRDHFILFGSAIVGGVFMELVASIWKRGKRVSDMVLKIVKSKTRDSILLAKP